MTDPEACESLPNPMLERRRSDAFVTLKNAMHPAPKKRYSVRKRGCVTILTDVICK
jgi:hypothetical protein